IAGDDRNGSHRSRPLGGFVPTHGRSMKRVGALPLSTPYSALMQVIISAVGPDNRGLADPIIHYVTGQGANIAEIQMYDHDEEALFAMLLRIELTGGDLPPFRSALEEIGRLKNLSVRVWSPDERAARPRLAICVTYRPEPPLALLRAIRDGQLKAEAAVMIGNRKACRGIAEQFGVPW